jgi:hypothetical protein
MGHLTCLVLSAVRIIRAFYRLRLTCTRHCEGLVGETTISQDFAQMRLFSPIFVTSALGEFRGRVLTSYVLH